MNDYNYPFAYGDKNKYFMFHRKYIPIQEFETSTKNQYHYSIKKGDESKDDKITDDNEGIIEYGNDYIKCKIIDDRDSIKSY